MIIKLLYRYYKDNMIIDSLSQPEGEYIERYRLIAEEGKVLTQDNETLYSVIDINQEDLTTWVEIDKPIEEQELNEL